MDISDICLILKRKRGAQNHKFHNLLPDLLPIYFLMCMGNKVGNKSKAEHEDFRTGCK